MQESEINWEGGYTPETEIKKTFRTALDAKDYKAAYYALSELLLNHGVGPLDSTLASMARELALQCFRHNKNDRLYGLRKLVRDSYLPADILPETQDRESSLGKAVQREYEECADTKNDIDAYTYAKIGGLLDARIYRTLFDIAINKEELNIDRAHKYAMEGDLYDIQNPETKALLDELAELEKKWEEISEVRQKMRDFEISMSFEEFNQKYSARTEQIRIRRRDIMELLVAGVE